MDITKHGYEIVFESEPCEQPNRIHVPIKFNEKEQDIIDKLLNKFENKGVIVNTKHERGEMLSHIFIRPKLDGTHRLNPSIGEILSFLTQLNVEGLWYNVINTAKSMLSATFHIIH